MDYTMLRSQRDRAHDAYCRLWKTNVMSKEKVNSLVSKVLGVSIEALDFQGMNEVQYSQIEAACVKEANKTRYIVCHYCKAEAQYVDSSIVYHGKSYGMMYLCPKCRAYVGVHKGTAIPLGVLANAELRKWKKVAHDAFDTLWSTGIMTRSEAYLWLAVAMGKTIAETHIGMFLQSDCETAIELCSTFVKVYNQKSKKG